MEVAAARTRLASALGRLLSLLVDQSVYACVVSASLRDRRPWAVRESAPAKRRAAGYEQLSRGRPRVLHASAMRRPYPFSSRYSPLTSGLRPLSAVCGHCGETHQFGACHLLLSPCSSPTRLAGRDICLRRGNRAVSGTLRAQGWKRSRSTTLSTVFRSARNAIPTRSRSSAATAATAARFAWSCPVANSSAV